MAAKMAAKMAAGANRKNNFRSSGLTIACDTTFLGKRVMSNPFLGVLLQFEVNITVKGHVQIHFLEIMYKTNCSFACS